MDLQVQFASSSFRFPQYWKPAFNHLAIQQVAWRNLDTADVLGVSMVLVTNLENQVIRKMAQFNSEENSDN